MTAVAQLIDLKVGPTADDELMLDFMNQSEIPYFIIATKLDKLNKTERKAALEALRDYEPRRLVCLFGSVGERTQCRRRERGDVANELSDFTYLTADNPGFERVEDICADIAASFSDESRYLIIPDRAKAVRTALEGLCEGEVLLLAGKGDEQSQAICGRLVPYSDRAVVEEYLSELAVPV